MNTYANVSKFIMFSYVTFKVDLTDSTFLRMKTLMISHNVCEDEKPEKYNVCYKTVKGA